MGFLSGRFSCERFRVEGKGPKVLGTDHLKILRKYAIGDWEPTGEDQTQRGFLAGRHIFDTAFHPERNFVNDALQAAMRIDANQIPSALRKAWVEIELAAAAAENPSGRPTKAQRQAAKEVVEERCREELATGKYRKMRQFPWLWDIRDQIVYLGSSSAGIIEAFTGLFQDAFGLSLKHLTAGELGSRIAAESRQKQAFADLEPAVFTETASTAEFAWIPPASGGGAFLGNEFLLWLWWWGEKQGDTLTLPDDSRVTFMLAKTLSLECPLGESGKETISAIAPAALPEAAQAIRCGKLPRKSGLILVRSGEQYEFSIQAESLGFQGVGIQTSSETIERGDASERIDQIRRFTETFDLVFAAFCRRRCGNEWKSDLAGIRKWLRSEVRTGRSAA